MYDMKTNSELTIFTVGHGNLPIWKFIELIKSKDIDILVDVRSMPFSRHNPQFNKDLLKSYLGMENIDYRYAGDKLGGRPTDPDCYKDGVLPDGKADYLHLVDYPKVMTKEFFLKGIDFLLSIGGTKKVTVMCSESDPAQCHRHHMIGRYLVSQGVNVLHIYQDGHTLKDQFLPNLNAEAPVEQMSLF